MSLVTSATNDSQIISNVSTLKADLDKQNVSNTIRLHIEVRDYIELVRRMSSNDMVWQIQVNLLDLFCAAQPS